MTLRLGQRVTPETADRVRVVLATRIFTPDSAAAAFRLQALVEALAERGAAVEVLTSRSSAGTPMSGEPGQVVVRRWPVRRDSEGYVRGYLPYLSFDLPLVLRLLGTVRPDVIVVEPPPTTGAVVRAVTAVRSVLARRRIPYVYYAADVWSDASASTGAPPPVVAVLRALERYALRGASDVIAVSDGVAQRVRDLGARVVHVIPNGIGTETFAQHDPEPELTRISSWTRDIPSGPFLVYAGTASEWQGAEIFAEAMRLVTAEVARARLVFLGQGSSWPALRRIADELPDGVIEMRPVAPGWAAAAWQRAASAALVSVKPGLGYDFAYPTKVLAALACGTRVVYVGPGPAAADLAEHWLGDAVAYDVVPVAAAMVRALRADPDESAAHRRATWVQQHRSLDATAAAAADIVLR